MFGPLTTTFHSNAPQLMTVPAAVVYSAAVNLSLDRWTAVFKQEGVEVRGLLVFLTWNLPFFSTFVSLWARYGERDMYAYVSWCTVQVHDDCAAHATRIVVSPALKWPSTVWKSLHTTVFMSDTGSSGVPAASML